MHMRRPILVAGMVLFLDLSWYAATGKAELYCEQPVHQAGQVRNGLPLSHRFTIINRSTVGIEITDVRSTCGCLSPQIEKRTLGPGEQGTVLLEINTLTLAQGTQSWRSRLIYREREKTNELELIIVGDVVTEVLVQPSALTLPAELPGSHAITVTDTRSHALTVRAVETGSACLRATIGAVRREDGSSVQKISIAVPDDCPEGRHNLSLHLYTDDPLYREFTVPITVVKRPRQSVSVVPARLVLEGDKGQPIPARLVRISTATGAEVEIERVATDDSVLRCTASKGTGTVATVRIEIDPTHLNGDFHSDVRVHLLKPTPETVTIPVWCVVR
jgi:hypothetical protein